MIKKQNLEHILATNDAVLFVSGGADVGGDAPNTKAREIFEKLRIPILVVDLLKDSCLRDQVMEKSGWFLTPQLFLNGIFLGGMFVIPELLRSREYFRWTNSSPPNNLDEILAPYLKRFSSPWKIDESSTHYWMASACGSVKSVSKLDLREEQSISLSSGWVNAISVINNDLIVAGTTDGTILSGKGDKTTSLELICSHDRWLNDFTYSEKSSRLYAIDGSGRVVYSNNFLQHTALSRGPNFDSTGWSIDLSSDKETLAIGLGDGKFVLLNSNDFSEIYGATLHDGAITSIKSKDGAFFFCGYDGIISRMDIGSMTLTQTRTHHERVWDIAVTDRVIASIGGDMRLSLMDTSLSTHIASFDLPKMPILIRTHGEGFCVFYSDGSYEALPEWCKH